MPPLENRALTGPPQASSTIQQSFLAPCTPRGSHSTGRPRKQTRVMGLTVPIRHSSQRLAAGSLTRRSWRRRAGFRKPWEIGGGLPGIPSPMEAMLISCHRESHVLQREDAPLRIQPHVLRSKHITTSFLSLECFPSLTRLSKSSYATKTRTNCTSSGIKS